MLNVKLEKENIFFVDSFEKISIRPAILAVFLVSSVITILAVKQISEVPSNTTMLTSRVTQCAKKVYVRGRVRSTRRYFWRKDCPVGWHPV